MEERAFVMALKDAKVFHRQIVEEAIPSPRNSRNKKKVIQLGKVKAYLDNGK